MSRNILFITLLALLGLCSSGHSQIKAGKAVQITISGVPPEENARFNQMFPVSTANGTVNMPFIGPVQAAGRSADDLALELQKRYKAAGIYTNPTFQVIDSDQKTIDQQIVIIGGSVRRPGPTPYFDRMTLWQAVQAAGGATEFGSMKRVRLTRVGAEPRIYNCNEAANQQILLRPGDSIDVPEKDIWGN